MIISVIAWIVCGALAGWLAHLLIRSDFNDAMNDISAGIIGALIGGFMSKALAGGSLENFELRSFVAAIAGSVALLLLLKSVRRPHTSV